MASEAGDFDDADALSVELDAVDAVRLADTWAALIRADLSGTRPGCCLAAVRAGDLRRAARAVARAFSDGDLAAFVAETPARRAAAVELALALAPADVGPAHSVASTRRVASFDAWGDYPHQLLIVPGYTPPSQATPLALHDVARARCAQAAEDLRAGLAPFVLVSGADVYPEGTPYHEAVEMKRALLAMGVDDDRVVVEARARHSTTNLRNAGRFMRAHGLTRGLVTTLGGGVGGSEVFDQDFYFSHPTLSTFHLRCERELGYRLGELSSAGDRHTTFVPSASVVSINYRDPLDP
jgi:hypothetical protein